MIWTDLLRIIELKKYGIIQKPNMIVINIATFIRNRGKIREQLAGVASYNSFSNNNEI